MSNIYNQDFDRNRANYEPLSACRHRWQPVREGEGLAPKVRRELLGHSQLSLAL